MNKADKYYKENLKRIFEEWNKDENPRPKYKDGTPAHSYFITQVFETYNLEKGEFPITTLRNTAIKTGIKEVFWIYKYKTSSLKKAEELGINWWNEWDIGNGTIGCRYGETINKWKLMDKTLKGLKENPFGRRHYINMLQESDLKETKGLYPCAYGTHWSVRKKENHFYLDMTLIQRSQDAIMATYINKTQYVALQMMVASHLGYKVGKFCHFIQNYHIYDRHINAAKEILNKKSLNIQPKMELKENKNFYDIELSDFEFSGLKNIKKIKSNLEIAI